MRPEERVRRWQQIAGMKDLAASPNAKVIVMGGGDKGGATILDAR